MKDAGAASEGDEPGLAGPCPALKLYRLVRQCDYAMRGMVSTP